MNKKELLKKLDETKEFICDFRKYWINDNVLVVISHEKSISSGLLVASWTFDLFNQVAYGSDSESNTGVAKYDLDVFFVEVIPL